MNIAIVGAGIIGISTALELARDGHQVTVYEQLNAPAEDASFAPGGWLSPSITHSLSVPGAGMPLPFLRKARDVLQTSNLIGSPTWRWMRQWKLHEKHASKHHDYTLRDALMALSGYSDALRWQHCDDTEAAAEHKTSAMVLLRSAKEVDFWEQQRPSMQALGLGYQLLPAEQARALEPGLGHEMPWSHALVFAQAQSINPRLWTHFLRQQAQSLGVDIHTGVLVQKISTQPIGVQIKDRVTPHDAVVICSGSNSQLLPPLGIELPSMPAWGYSVTAPVRDALQAPRSAVMDWAEQATISRMGQRIRITAGLELGSNAQTPQRHTTLERMYRLLNDWFPGGAHLSSPQVQVWRGARSYLPDGLPAVGHSVQRGIWLNMAHGSHGAALAAGCARALADQITNREAAIDMRCFSPLRFA